MYPARRKVMTPQQYKRRERRAQISELYKKKYMVHEIADMVGTSITTVSKDIKYLHNLWEKSQIENIKSVKLRELAELDGMERICMERLEGCTQPWQGARWMEERRKIKEHRASLLGLDAPKNINHEIHASIFTKEQKDAAFNIALGVTNTTKLIDEIMEGELIVPKIAYGDDALDDDIT